MGLDKRDTLMFRTGLPGSGKSYSLTKYIVEEYLPTHDGVVYTNVPLKPEAIAEYYVRQRGHRSVREKMQAEEFVAKRIHLIPEATDVAWEAKESTPEDFFNELWEKMLADEGLTRQSSREAIKEAGLVHPLNHALLVFDEAGRKWPSNGSGKMDETTAKFVNFIRTLRHTGARMCLVMQDSAQVAAPIRRLKATELHCTNLRSQIEPCTGADMDDWFQLWAKLTGTYYTICREEEYVSIGQGKEELAKVNASIMWPKYFDLYDSHNSPGDVSGEEEPPQWQRYGWIKFIIWIVSRNFINWGWRLSLLVLIYVMIGPPFYYGPKIFNGLINKAQEVALAKAGTAGKNPSQQVIKNTEIKKPQGVNSDGKIIEENRNYGTINGKPLVGRMSQQPRGETQVANPAGNGNPSATSADLQRSPSQQAQGANRNAVVARGPVVSRATRSPGAIPHSMRNQQSHGHGFPGTGINPGNASNPGNSTGDITFGATP